MALFYHINIRLSILLNDFAVCLFGRVMALERALRFYCRVLRSITPAVCGILRFYSAVGRDRLSAFS